MEAKAIECHQRSVDLNPQNSWAWFDFGVTCVNGNNDEKAAECFMKSIEINPQNAWSWAYMGLILSKHEKFNDALQAYNKALELAPDNKVIKNSRDRVLARIN